MDEPYIKLYKKLLKWEWYDDPNTKVLFLHCLLKANYQETRWHGVSLEPGQFITSLPKLAEELNLSIKQVRVALDHLKQSGEVADKGQTKYRIITVLKWDEYQGQGRQRADKGQTKGRQGAAVKEIKEYKNNNKYYEDTDLDKTFSDYVAMRIKIRKPMSDRAIELAKAKLNKLSGGDKEKSIEILNQSILGSWQGLYELKQDKAVKKNGFSNFEQRKYDFDELEKEMKA